MDDAEREILTGIVRRDPHYTLDAYQFVAEGVQYTVHSRKRAEKTGLARHVTGSELVHGITELAASRYGFLAADVFEYWRLKTGRDIGNIVYAMIGAGILAASPNDRIEDFDGVTDDLAGDLRAICETARQ